MLRGARALRKATIIACILAGVMSIYAYVKTRSPVHLAALALWITLLASIHYIVKI